MYLQRSSPIFQHPYLLDDCLKSCATDICNVSFDDIGWIQATLPIRLGGIGLRRTSDLALPAYLAAISASQSFIYEITQPDHIPHALDSCFDVWSPTNPSLPENANLQLTLEICILALKVNFFSVFIFCIWHLPTMLKIGFCHTYSLKSVFITMI